MHDPAWAQLRPAHCLGLKPAPTGRTLLLSNYSFADNACAVLNGYERMVKELCQENDEPVEAGLVELQRR